ncbi:MAG: nucleotidyltransferase domain-containing protein [Acidobacteriota bacterium]
MVVRALQAWAKGALTQQPQVLALGYFGSYARGDWGVGSDLDLIIVVRTSQEPFQRRAAQWDTSGFPVPADLLVYTSQEWRSLRKTGTLRSARKDIVWLHCDPDVDRT